MGKPKAASAFSKAMTSHYGVKLTASAETTKGSTAAFMINGEQAVAGVSYPSSQFNPAKDQCSKIADKAETEAQKLYSQAQKAKPPKKMTGGEVYAVGN
jgi:hypothetical protein